MGIAIITVVAACAGICTGVLLHKWTLIEVPQKESVLFSESYPPRAVSIGRHRRYDSFPISNVVRLPNRELTMAEEEQDLSEAMGFLAAIQDDHPIEMPPVPEPIAIEAPPTWTQEHVWGKSLQDMVDELEQAAYAHS
jgi:hypothetical protein